MKTKLLAIIFVFLFIIGTAGTLWGTQIAEAASGFWNTCPRGQINCRYPGKCNLYIDTNGDRICDRSQSNPNTVTTTPAVKATTPAVSTIIPTITTTPTSTPNTSNGGIWAAVLSSNTPIIDDQNAAVSDAAALELKHSYYFLPILLVISIFYALTWTLSAKKVIRNLLHRKIWNFILLFAMLISALLGLFLILVIDFNIEIALPFNMLFWHVEAGIALGIIGIFHIFWHWRYFAKVIKPAT